MDAETYYQESLEHAGATDKKALSLIKEVTEKMDLVRNEAKKIIAKKSFV